jgi:hypothetical protein
VPPDFKGSDDVAVRQYLEPIAKLCSDSRVTMLGLTHFGKRDSADSGLLILGSIAWSQVARSVVSIADDPASGTKVLTNTKSNYATRTRSVEFSIGSTLIDTQDGPTEVGVVEWIGDTDKDARDLLKGRDRPDDEEEFDERDYTTEFKTSWLYLYLAAAHRAGESIRPKDAVAVGADKGIGRRSVFRLFDKLANAGMAESVDQPGFPRVTHWVLKTDETTADHPPTHKSGGTTGTTGPDLRKQVGTTGELFDQGGTTGDTGSDQQKQDAAAPVVPVVPPDLTCAAPSGAPTASTPGMTGRVEQALANARKRRPGCVCVGQPQPCHWCQQAPCIVCGQPMAVGQTEMHPSCRQVAEAGRSPDESDDRDDLGATA